MTPDLELVRIPHETSFKVWAHGYPFRTVRWHFHPEYELHLVTSTQGNRYVGDHIAPFGPGDLVLIGPNLPHNWISDVSGGESVSERCHILQFTETFIGGCLDHLPELRTLRPLLAEARRGLLFDPAVASRVAGPMRDLLEATSTRRIALFMEILDVIARAAHTPLASIGYRPDAGSFRSTAMNVALEHIARNFTHEIGEPELAALCRQSVSTFSRSFFRHTGMKFVKYVNSLRVELACQHLSLDDAGITDICYEVGFRNISNFNRQFLSIKGMSPSRFRALQRAGRSLAVAA
jgi:AraC-like DNA-binding protein